MHLVEQIYQNGISRLVEFSRVGGKRKAKLITNFRPYFFLEEGCIIEDESIVKIESGFTTIDGAKVKKVYVKNSGDVVRLREGRNTWESDFLFTNRYIVDNYKDIPREELKVLYFDIETDSDNVLPDIETPDQAITCISNEIEGFMNTFVWREDLKNSFKSGIDYRINYFDNEVEMLKAFIDYIKEEDPDILSAYNLKGFDLPYIVGRMGLLKIDYTKLSPLKYVKFNRNGLNLKGRIQMDILELLKHPFIKSSEMASYTLDDVSKEILGEEKIKHKESFREMWKNDLNKLIKYNQRDVELLRKIDKKKKIIDFFDIVRRITKCQFDDFRSYSFGSKTFYGTSKVLDCYMFSTFPDMVFPNKGKLKGETFRGAYCLEPVPGLYKNVLCLDLEALYPSIIKTFNISYETLDPKGEIDIDGIRFKKEKGFIPKLLEKQKKERGHFKKLMKEAKTTEEFNVNNQRQEAIKILGNALYGIMGNPRSRLYKKELAASVTKIGRDIVNYTKEMVEKLGFKVLYGDTDSNYILSKKEKTADVLKEGIYLRKEINKCYDDFAKRYGNVKHFFNIEFEKVAKSFIFLFSKKDTGAKKRYAYKLLWSNKKFDPNRIYITGSDAVRSDSNPISKKLQSDVLEMVLDDIPEEVVKDYLRKIEKDIRDKKYSIEEIGFPVQIKQALHKYKSKSPVIVGAFYAKEHLNKDYGKGMKPKWLPIKEVIGYPPTKYLTFNDVIPDGFKIDYDRVVRKTIKDKVETTFKTCGWDWEDLCVGNKSIKRWF